jgi:hypothetical protein
MVRAGVLATSIAALACVPASAAASQSVARTGASVRPARSIGKAHVTVTPTSGSPTTRFTVRFRAPERTGRFRSSRRAYVLSAVGPASKGCNASADISLPASRAHVLRKVVLDPKRLHQSWCVGTYRGQVEETQIPICPKGHACPALVILLGTVGRFSFRVAAQGAPKPPSPPTGDHTPPTFAGLASASACTPGPQRPGETTPFTLGWQPASDGVTPTTEIVYDIFEATTAGGENYSQPTWTTLPGASSFRTPPLSSHGTFYFVVRARDEAGNEDRNTVERRGIDPCV